MTETPVSMSVSAPVPGGRLDAVAAAAAQTSGGQVPAEAVTDVSGRARPVVPVAEDLPAQGRGYVVVLSAANPVLPILPQSDQRRSAVVLAVDNDVYIASSHNDAQAAAGAATSTTAFYLPKGIALPVNAKCAWWASATTTASTSRVSVLPCLDEP